MKESYKGYSFRLNDKTKELLDLVNNNFGKSWNLMFYELLKEHINKNKNTYREYFKDIYSKYRKKNCEVCGELEKTHNIKNLCVHHKDGNIMNNNPDNLMTLCQSCHGKQWPK